jgi:hypothetical protein
MASGILGQSAPAAATNTSVYTVPGSGTSRAVFNVSMVNTSGAPVAVRLAVAGTGTPGIAEYIEYDTILPGNGVLERGGLVAQTGENVVAYVSAATVSVSVYGYEE